MKNYATQSIYVPGDRIDMMIKVVEAAKESGMSLNVFLLTLIEIGFKKYQED